MCVCVCDLLSFFFPFHFLFYSFCSLSRSLSLWVKEETTSKKNSQIANQSLNNSLKANLTLWPIASWVIEGISETLNKCYLAIQPASPRILVMEKVTDKKGTKSGHRALIDSLRVRERKREAKWLAHCTIWQSMKHQLCRCAQWKGKSNETGYSWLAICLCLQVCGHHHRQLKHLLASFYLQSSPPLTGEKVTFSFEVCKMWKSNEWQTARIECRDADTFFFLSAFVLLDAQFARWCVWVWVFVFFLYLI